MSSSTGDAQGTSSQIFYIGAHHNIEQHVPVSDYDFDCARGFGYDMVTVPITTTAFREHVCKVVEDSDTPLISSLTPEYTDLTPSMSTSTMIGVISPWIDVSSADSRVALISRQVLNMEIAYAAFCGISNVILPPLFRSKNKPTREAISRYADAVASATRIGPYLQFLVPFPMDDQRPPPRSSILSILSTPSDDAVSSKEPNTDPLAPWDAWNLVRSVCNYHAKLTISLEVPRLLPSQLVRSRWYSEPIRVIHLPTTTFVDNASGNPALSKAHQTLITEYMRIQVAPWILLSASGFYSPHADASPVGHAHFSAMDAHLEYMRFLQRNQPPMSQLDRFAHGYQDYLQSPLQPLTDNLESITYEVFEKDPIKYEWYEKAVALALRDLYSILQRPIVLAVVGAGRGPLMTRSLMASLQTNVPIVPYAVEKNPNALVLIHNRNANDPLWAGQVTVVKSDMRAWKGPLVSDQPTKIDIMVSELLGSFGDNELSPECLDGAQHLLHPEHGVSIPQSYTAWVTPISSPRIHGDLLHRPASDIYKWSLPYVTLLHHFDFLSFSDTPLSPGPGGSLSFAPNISQCWEFVHPLPAATIATSEQRRKGGSSPPGLEGGDGWNEHNSRRCNLAFPIPVDGRGVCHGLGGYFESVLYKPRNTALAAIELSTNPNSMSKKSEDMISWFPIFFPLKTPLYVPDGAQMEVVMERKTDDRKVWYTWQVSVWVEIGGVKQRTGVSEVHSTVENGCLM